MTEQKTVSTVYMVEGTKEEIDRLQHNLQIVSKESGESLGTVTKNLLQHALEITPQTVEINGLKYPVNSKVFELIQFITKERDKYLEAIETIGGKA